MALKVSKGFWQKGAGPSVSMDDTAESVPDTAATLAEEFSKHVEVALLAQQTHQQEMQLRIDRMATVRSGFTTQA